MREALKEADLAFTKDEIPIGAVIVSHNRIIGRGHNLTEQLQDVTAHAEMQAFTAAANFLGGKYLDDCSLYVTLEPCVMCAGAAYWTRVSRIIYGCKDEKRGYSLVNNTILHPKTLVTGGILEDECKRKLQEFFRGKR